MAKILVADDNSNIQKMVGLALKDQGIEVVAVGNGEAAVRKISDLHPDLVLADVFMPVRNGYEVCKYVKDDSTLAHIPVILLVGAFDPLDEQEAQRVGADGVLKKPFVPPDPLISMVKSALARAGVALGNPPAAAEKPQETPSRKAAEMLSPAVGSTLAVPGSERAPHAMPEPIGEELPAHPERLKIAAGQEPLAFGSLMETPEVEDESAFLPPAKGGLADEHNWGTGATEEEEEELEAKEEEEESPRGGWRPGALADLDDSALPTRKAPDWREQAFHGSSPAKRAPATEIHVAEAIEVPAAAVSTIERAPAETPAPFAGDAWAAVMAADIEQKLRETTPSLSDVLPGKATDSPSQPETQDNAAPAVESMPEKADSALEEVKSSEPASSWFSASSSPWDVEAKKASQLASTWDAPVEQSPEETQEVASYAAPELELQAGAEPDVETASAYAAESSSEIVGHAEAAIGSVQEPEVHEQEVHQPEFHQPEVAVVEHVAPAAAEAVVEAANAAPASQPNMDELVARVLGKLSPDVLQRVTQEILKPVIEAIVREELDSKKS